VRRLVDGPRCLLVDDNASFLEAATDLPQRQGVALVGANRPSRIKPAPAHDVGIWVGAGMPRMLRLVGRRADGWSVPIRLFLPGGPPTLAEPNRVIDEAAAAAGRDPSAVRRILTFPGRFSRLLGGLLDGPPAQWAEELADMALRYGVGAVVLGFEEAATIERFAAEVVPATRELVAAERHAAATT
jgi:alkanesulfonate monooxygenase SsuD/methylene tetrahydromethanopterin reductase-like flavin-dependent oxidoreductase (luciferase family)